VPRIDWHDPLVYICAVWVALVAVAVWWAMWCRRRP